VDDSEPRQLLFASFRERLLDFRSCWIVFIHVVRELLRSFWPLSRLLFSTDAKVNSSESFLREFHFLVTWLSSRCSRCLLLRPCYIIQLIDWLIRHNSGHMPTATPLQLNHIVKRCCHKVCGCTCVCDCMICSGILWPWLWPVILGQLLMKLVMPICPQTVFPIWPKFWLHRSWLVICRRSMVKVTEVRKLVKWQISQSTSSTNQKTNDELQYSKINLNFS